MMKHKNKKMIAFMLSMAILMPTVNIVSTISNDTTMVANAEDEYTNIADNTVAELSFNNGTVTIEKYKGTDTTINIPPTVTVGGIEYTVTAIGYQAFYANDNIISVTIPDTVKSIDSYAFQDCHNLQTVNLPTEVSFEGIDYINYFGLHGSTFQGCTSLTEIKIPNGVDWINRNVFSGCTALKNVYIPETVKKIETTAFENCTSLENITLPVDLKVLGDGVFKGCTALKSIEIPKKVQYIPFACFENCTSLESVTILHENTPECHEFSYRNIESYAFNGCTSLKEITLPSTFTNIRSNCHLGTDYVGIGASDNFQIYYYLDLYNGTYVDPGAILTYANNNGLNEPIKVNNPYGCTDTPTPEPEPPEPTTTTTTTIGTSSTYSNTGKTLSSIKSSPATSSNKDILPLMMASVFLGAIAVVTTKNKK